MSTAWLVEARYEGDSVVNRDAALDGTAELRDQIQDSTDHSLNRLTGIEHNINPSDHRFERDEYLKLAVEDLHDDGKLLDNDHILLLDDLWIDGYGRVLGLSPGEYEYDGNTYYVARCYAGSAFNTVSSDEVYQMAIHEAGHTFNASHQHGDYSLSFDGGDSLPVDITPMATPYVREENGDPASCGGITGSFGSYYQGGGTEVDDFCTTSNEIVDGSPPNCKDDYIDNIASCAMNQIDQHIGGL